MHTDTHSATEHTEVDSDYTTHDSLQGPDFPLTGVLSKCIQVHPISSHTHFATVLKRLLFINFFYVDYPVSTLPVCSHVLDFA